MIKETTEYCKLSLNEFINLDLNLSGVTIQASKNTLNVYIHTYDKNGDKLRQIYFIKNN